MVLISEMAITALKLTAIKHDNQRLLCRNSQLSQCKLKQCQKESTWRWKPADLSV